MCSQLKLWCLLLIVRGEPAQGAAYPATPHSTPAEGTFSPDAPIQFDLTTPGSGSGSGSSPREGPPKYVEL